MQHLAPRVLPLVDGANHAALRRVGQTVAAGLRGETMARQVTLFAGQWADLDLPPQELVALPASDEAGLG